MTNPNSPASQWRVRHACLTSSKVFHTTIGITALHFHKGLLHDDPIQTPIQCCRGFTQGASGFGRRSVSQPPTFCLPGDLPEAVHYFSTHGFAVLRQALTCAELSQLNTFFDQSQATHPEQWGLGSKRKPHHRNQGLILSQPLLDHPELDTWLQHPGAYPLIEAVLGGSDAVRWSEFNFREAPAGAGPGQMNFHHDAVMADRFTRTPYGPCDWVCSIHYLTDVDTASPAFCVVPGTHRFESLQDAYETLGMPTSRFLSMAKQEPRSSTTLRFITPG